MTPDQDPLGAMDVLRWTFDKLWVLLGVAYAMLSKKFDKQESAHDELKKSVQAIQVDYASRDTVETVTKDWRDEMREMRKEINDNLKSLNERLDKVIDK